MPRKRIDGLDVIAPQGERRPARPPLVKLSSRIDGVVDSHVRGYVFARMQQDPTYSFRRFWEDAASEYIDAHPVRFTPRTDRAKPGRRIAR